MIVASSTLGRCAPSGDDRSDTALSALSRAVLCVSDGSPTAVAARLLARLCAAAPLLPGRDRLAYLDIDDTIRGNYGYAKQGAGRGYSGVNGLNALLRRCPPPQQPR